MAESSGWKPKTIAERLSIGTSAVSQYKLGRTRPSDTVLELFEAKLRVQKQEAQVSVERGTDGGVRFQQPEESSTTQRVIGLQPESDGVMKDAELASTMGKLPQLKAQHPVAYKSVKAVIDEFTKPYAEAARKGRRKRKGD